MFELQLQDDCKQFLGSIPFLIRHYSCHKSRQWRNIVREYVTNLHPSVQTPRRLLCRITLAGICFPWFWIFAWTILHSTLYLCRSWIIRILEMSGHSYLLQGRLSATEENLQTFALTEWSGAWIQVPIQYVKHLGPYFCWCLGSTQYDLMYYNQHTKLALSRQ